MHHRSGATSELLGLYRRGFLFERNAFLTVYKNLDDELWPRLMPVVMLTLLARSQHLLARANPGGEVLAIDPYAAHDQSPVAPRSESDISSAAAAGRFGNLRRGDLAGAWRSLRRRLDRLAGGPAASDGTSAPRLTDERTVAQLQAVSSLLGDLDGAASAGAARRRRAASPTARSSPASRSGWCRPTPETKRSSPRPASVAGCPPTCRIVEATLAEVMEWG